VAGAACGHKHELPPPATGAEHSTAPARAAVQAKRVVDAAHAPATARQVASIGARALGPFVARAGDVGVAVWIAPAPSGSGRELVAVPLAGDGAPLAEPRVVAKLGQEETALVVRPSGNAHGGWLLAWSALLDRGESLTVLGLAADGTARGTPTDVARTSDHIKWCDLVATSVGAVAVWAEETRSGDANILATPIDGDGKPVGMPVRVARGVDRWSVASVDDGVGLALVAATDASGRSGATAEARPPAGRLSWLRLDAKAHPTGGPIPVSAKPTVSGDVDVAVTPKGAVLAWTDRTGEDAQVMLARVDPSGQVLGPGPAMDAVGGASLVALASGPGGAALAWEEPSARAHAQRSLHLAAVTQDAASGRLTAQSITAIAIAQDAAPELVATASGFAVLAPARACVATYADRAQGGCDGPIAPTFVRFDDRLQPVQSEPLILAGSDGPASIGWGLRCAGDRCFALAAASQVPTPIYTVDLEPRASPFATPAAAPLPPDAPRVTSVQTVASGPSFDDLAEVRLADATVVATLGPAPSEDEARRARGSAITLRVLDDSGRPRSASQALTSRAVPIGGVAMAPGGTPQDGAAVAWVTGSLGGGLDDPARQVHVAHLDKTGRRNREVELSTRARGDVSGVALAWAGDGWLVAWVDGRDGNGEVYATKVDRDLARVAGEERVTRAPGDAGDVTLAVRGSVAWLAWSDPRESPREGLADIYATTLHTTDAKRASDEVRVLASAPHSRSPQLAATPAGDGAVLTWIEDAATGLEGPGAAMVAVLDRDGRVVRAPSILPLAGPGRPTSVALATAPDGVRAVVVRSGQEAISLDAMVLGADGAPGNRPWSLLDLEAPASFDVSLALATEGDSLLYDDVGAAPGEHLVRRAELAWRR
jgi:hypothetical protein